MIHRVGLSASTESGYAFHLPSISHADCICVFLLIQCISNRFDWQGWQPRRCPFFHCCFHELLWLRGHLLLGIGKKAFSSGILKVCLNTPWGFQIRCWGYSTRVFNSLSVLTLHHYIRSSNLATLIIPTWARRLVLMNVTQPLTFIFTTLMKLSLPVQFYFLQFFFCY